VRGEIKMSMPGGVAGHVMTKKRIAIGSSAGSPGVY
jgi:hypothetical protein